MENRYDFDLLEETCPNGWDEIDAPETIVAVVDDSVKPTMRRLLALTSTTDLNGNRLEPGCNVRFYSSAFYDPATDTLLGIAITPTSGIAIDGTLELIDDTVDPPVYVIRSMTEDYPVVDTRLLRQTGELKVTGRNRQPRHSADSMMRIAVNGSPICRCIRIDAKGAPIVLEEPTCPQFAIFRM